MKKVSFCIAVVLVLVFTAGAHAKPATGDLSAFDGTWLKLTFKFQRGLEFFGYDSINAPQKMQAGARTVYACMDFNPLQPEAAYLRFFDRDGTPIGFGSLAWDAGTDLEFLGYLEANLATDVTYEADQYGFPVGSYVYDTRLSGFVSVRGGAVDKTKIQSISGEGYIQAPDATMTTGRYAGFGYILNGGFTKGEKMPQISPACGEMEFIL